MYDVNKKSALYSQPGIAEDMVRRGIKINQSVYGVQNIIKNL